jgi:hypothetical protein
MIKLRDVLVPEIRARFAGRQMRIGKSPGPVIVFPAVDAEVGDLRIHDDGDEVTLFIGDHSHLHFSIDADAGEEQEQMREVTESTLDFLSNLFADRVLMQCSADHRMGEVTIESGGLKAPVRADGWLAYRWSGRVR